MSTEKYIDIKPHGVSKTGKTKVWEVRNNKHHTVIGYIKWYGGFRKYCFYPLPDTLFDHHCLLLIHDHLSDVNIDHRNQKKHCQ
jgi:hypothetical protein